LVEAYELFGCNTADIVIISINVDEDEDNAACIQYNEEHGIPFPTISGVEGNGDAIGNTYGISPIPTYILIAPDHEIVDQDIWPASSVQNFIDAFEAEGVVQAECGGVAANFSSDVTSVCAEGTINFSDMSSGDITSWLWTFEGGDPETSTEENPAVFYNTLGSWDVTLNVNGDEGDTFTVENYIDVFEVPDVTQEPLDGACIFWIPYELSGGLPEGGEYSGPGVTDGMFDPEAAGLGTHTITYTYVSDDGCENSAEETLYVDACTGIDEITEDAVQVYPNPANDIVHISSESNMVSVSIYNYTGQLMESLKLNESSYQINTSSFPTGVYSIKIETEDNIITKQLIIK